ncbi:MFS transporter [bacterium]|nr:MFS transporter [bacterium]
MDRQAAVRGRWAIAAFFLVNGFIMGAWAPQIPLMLPRHGIGSGVMGLLILMIGIGAVGAMLFAGKLIAAHGSRRMATFFALLFVPTLPLIVLAPSIWVAAPVMLLFGAFGGCMDVSMNANSVMVERRLGQAIMSSSHGFWSLGGFLGGALGGRAIEAFSPGAQAIGVSVLSLVAVLLARRFLVPDVPHAAPAAEPARATLFPRVPVLYLLGAMALFSMVAEGAVLDWGALFLKQELGAGLAHAGLAFGFFSGAMAVMRFAGDGVRNRFGAVATLRISGLIGAVGLIEAALAPTDTMAIAGFAFSGLGVANMVPILFSAAGNHPGISAGAGIATVTMLGYCGILVAPSAIGFIAQVAGFRFTYAALAVLLVVVAALAGRAQAADGTARPAVALPLDGGV